jgi:GTPase SAR1 family protein
VARLTNPDRPLNHDISATMGIEFDTQMLDTPHGKVKAQIWDTAGQERFARVLLPTYFRKAKGVILVYDISSGKLLPYFYVICSKKKTTNPSNPALRCNISFLKIKLSPSSR